MVLTQIVITTAANTLYAIGVPSGRRNVKVVCISYVQSDTTARNIVLVSNTFKIRFGNNSNIIFNSVYLSQVKQIGDFEFTADFSGNVDIALQDLATGIAPVNFTSCILYLDISDKE